jgi:hypothetical protein
VIEWVVVIESVVVTKSVVVTESVVVAESVVVVLELPESVMGPTRYSAPPVLVTQNVK